MYLHIFAEVPTLREVVRYTPVLPSQNVSSVLHIIISIFVIKLATVLSMSEYSSPELLSPTN
jgi:hypothetical protein